MNQIAENMKKIKSALLVAFVVIVVLNILVIGYSYNYNSRNDYNISEDEVLNFPKDFLWGSATASYQVEGGNFDSNWWEFEKGEGNIKNGDSARVAADHYNLYKKDIELMDRLSLNSYRFSLEWGRINPEKDVFVDSEIEHYRKILRALKKKGIKPMVTLWHHSLPTWFEKRGGWLHEDAAEDFLSYVNYAASELGDDVEMWIVMNEPMAYITTGYVSGKWPPAKKEPDKIIPLFRNLTRAHSQAYDVIHEVDFDAQVGIAEHASYVVPRGKWNPVENVAAFFVDYYWTHFLLDSVDDSLDFIGVHYYYKQEINLGMAIDALKRDPQDFEEYVLGREYYPHGLYETLLRFRKYKKPVYITEIGVPDYHEIPRDQFIREHVREMYYAIEDGVDLRGVYYWALLDSFEWSEGYDAKFGLISVDRETLKRRIKDESWEYGEIAECNCVGND